MALQEEVRPASAALRQRLGTARTLGARDARWLSVVGRLKAGATVSSTAAELDTVGRSLAVTFPGSNRDISATAVRLGEGPGARARARPVLALLTGAVVLVLAIACANVASLLLARAVTRRREVAVRMAIGAAQGRLVRQWLTEAVMLGLVGSAGGLVLAGWSAPILEGFGLPHGIDLGMNGRVLAFTLAMGVGTGLVFGLAPILEALRGGSFIALRDAQTAPGGARSTRLRGAFVIVQVALSLVLLVAAGLLIRTVQRAYAVDLGYQVDRLLVVDLSSDASYSPEAGQALYARVLERVNALPGIVSAAAARITVLSGTTRTLPVSVDGQPLRADRSNVIPVRGNVVSERYLETMGIPILRGRGFQKSDDGAASRVAIVSRSLADRLWPGVDPIGQTFLSLTRLEVVGVVPDTVYLSATERDPRPVYYLPLSQNHEPAIALHVRTAADPLAVVSVVRQAVRDIDSRLVLTRPRRMLDELDRSMAGQRTMAMLSGLLSTIAVLLAAVGLYGALAYSTRQRTPEVGLRLALGATPASVMGLIVFGGVRLVVTGIAMGCAGAYVAARYLRSQLFGVDATDPVTWLAVSAVLTTVGLIACAIPARKAMRIDPALTLKGS